MFLTPSKIIFIFTLMSGTLITVSANSWFNAWMGLEINLLSFIPLMTNTKNILSTEASLKYFLIQALASSILLFSVIFMNFNDVTNTFTQPLMPYLISSSLMLKMGAAPFHFWFPGTMEGLSWINCLILMTWQKIAPFALLSYILPLDYFSSFIIIMSILIGSIGGLNQTSLRKLLAYSSINHMGWMIASLMTGETTWMFYFTVYSFLTSSLVLLFLAFQLSHINQNFTLYLNPTTKFCLFLLLLSLGGLPPFMGFLPKWITIQLLVNTNQLFLITVMVITTLVTLFYYLRLTFSSFLFSYQEIKWNKLLKYNNLTFIMLLSLTTISSLGLTLSTGIFNLL